MADVICPTCKGTGIGQLIRIWDKKQKKWVMSARPCKDCKGSGHLPGPPS